MSAPVAARTGAGALDPLFRPEGILLVGASRWPGKLGAVMGRALESHGGVLGRVNARSPSAEHGLHRTACDAAEAHGQQFDLAVICVPASASASALEDAATAGVRAAVVCAGGFSEAGGRGVDHERALRAVAEDTGIRVLGPNTSGFFVPHAGLRASFVPAVADVPPGPVAMVAASGGVNHAVAFLLADAGVGTSLGVGLGIGFDVTASDVLEYLERDPATGAVALHVESVTDGERLLEAVARTTVTKPVVALVVGRNDVADFAESHTGALATSWRTTRAVLQQAGAVLVDDERELVDAVTALAHTRIAPSAEPAIGIVTAQAGPGLLLLDRLRGDGVHVPPLRETTRERLTAVLPPMTYQGNPVDTGRPSEVFAEVIAATGADPGVDAVVVYALEEPDSVDLERAFRDARATLGVPTVAAIGGAGPTVARTRASLRDLGVPAFASATGAAIGVRALVDDARTAHRRAAAASRPPSSYDPVLVDAAGGGWDEDRAKGLVEQLGVATPARRVCASADDAHAALDALGAPVAVKVLDAAVVHKTDVGGVHLGIASHEDLNAALLALRGIGADRVLIEAMVPSGIDLIVGARRDPVFGPVVLLGLGGTVAEAIADVTLRSVPLAPPEAAAMVNDLAGRDLLGGWRGGPMIDREQLGSLLGALGDLIAQRSEIREVEINPLRLTPAGLVALDAVVVAEEADQ